MIFDGAGQGKREEAGGEEGKEGAGVGRGEKDVKIWERGEKRKNLRAPLREGRRETRGWEGRGLPPVHPSYLKTGDDSYGFKYTPPPTHTLSGLRQAVINHFEKFVDPPTVIII